MGRGAPSWLVLVWGVFGNSVGSVGAAPASFCVWVGKAAPALRRNWRALRQGRRHLARWCSGVGVERGLASRWGGGCHSVGSVEPAPASFCVSERAGVSYLEFSYIDVQVHQVMGVV